MKIAYFTEWSPYVPSGVLRKIIGQVTAWREFGHEVLLVALSPSRPTAPTMDFDRHGEVFGCISEAALQAWPSARLGFVNKVVSAPRIVRRLRSFGPDVLYYRQQGPWYPGLARVLSTAPCVMEMNANFAEAEYWGPLQRRYARLTRHLTLSAAQAFVCVSDEIAAELSSYSKPTRSIPNSMWGNPNMGLPASGNSAPAYVFVGSPLTGASSWHGIDKIFPLAAAIPDSTFHVVGVPASDFAGHSIPPNVTFHGPLFGEDLVRLYEKCDVGLGTLALHRRSINQTSALKTLEYLMYGLPVVLGYEETEPKLNNSPYSLSIGNSVDNVEKNIDRIRSFGFEWLDRRVKADLTFLSRERIESKRLEFFDMVIKRFVMDCSPTSKPPPRQVGSVVHSGERRGQRVVAND